MKALLSHTPDAVVGLLIGIVVAEWVNPSAAPAYILVLVLTFLVVSPLIAGLRRRIAGRRRARDTDTDRSAP